MTKHRATRYRVTSHWATSHRQLLPGKFHWAKFHRAQGNQSPGNFHRATTGLKFHRTTKRRANSHWSSDIGHQAPVNLPGTGHKTATIGIEHLVADYIKGVLCSHQMSLRILDIHNYHWIRTISYEPLNNNKKSINVRVSCQKLVLSRSADNT